ncbi:unnamed protein product, partial [Iphiclides podalirius]
MQIITDRNKMSIEKPIGDGAKNAEYISCSNHRFLEPEKAVKTITDMAIWEKSEAYMEYTGFIATLNEAIKGKPLSVDCKTNFHLLNNRKDLEILHLRIGFNRKLQKTYRMEPAGSHGVWSLDDYQFVPFIWGSSQLIDQPKIYPPTKFLDDEVVDKFADDYMFLSCIKYIKEVQLKKTISN